jgi:phosphoribosylaminoimidazole-succinocarboxamide synthase
MKEGIESTNFNFPNQTAFYKGKVRDVYTIGDRLVMIATDRISAFDVVLPRPIPHKGQILNQIAAHFLSATTDILPNWLQSTPHPNVAIGIACEPYKVEMVIRGYLTGHAWRTYQSGERMLCGMKMPEGMKENDRFPEPIITPTTKASEGHDEDISADKIISTGLVSESDYRKLEKYTRTLFERGTKMAVEQGLILVDTKYEFGSKNGVIYIIDEIHTPDSSRYFYLNTYAQKQAIGEKQIQLSKEFVREWLMANGFQGKKGQIVPEMTDEFVESTSKRYIQLYELVTGKKFIKSRSSVLKKIEKDILNTL